MKNKLIAILTLALLLSGCSSDKAENNDLAKYDLKGNVKSVWTSELSFDLKVKPSWREEHTKLLVFNKQGNLTEGRMLGDRNILYYFTYKYDSLGNKSEYYQFSPIYPSNGEIKEVYKYDDNGNIIEKHIEDSTLEGQYTDRTCFYNYDKNGNLVEYTEYKDEDGDIIEKITYKYDDKGNIIEKDKKYNKETYKYDNDGNIIQIFFLNKMVEGSGGYKKIYKYDDYGNKIEEKAFEQSLELEGYYRTYQYSLDSKGNWIKMVKFEPDGEIIIEERKIEYYTVSDKDIGDVKAKEPIEKIEPMKNGKPLIKFSSIRSLTLGTHWLEVKETLGEPDIHYDVGVSSAESNVYWFAALDDYTNEAVHINVYFVNGYAKTVESTIPGKNMRTSPWESIRTPK